MIYLKALLLILIVIIGAPFAAGLMVAYIAAQAVWRM